jgi:thiopurine S-methyltransferase
MKKEFWLNKWKEGQTHFHQSEYNYFLEKHWKTQVSGTEKVFVPLCGKSNDMIFLKECGHEVIGVELSELAVNEFFDFNKIKYEKEQLPNFIKYHGDNITIYCGDLFELTPQMLNNVKYVYDRASLVALPIDIRINYLDFMRTILGKSYYFLQTIEFENQLIGPPFSITENMVNQYFCENVNVTLLDMERSEGKDVNVHSGKINYTESKFYLIEPITD